MESRKLNLQIVNCPISGLPNDIICKDCIEVEVPNNNQNNQEQDQKQNLICYKCFIKSHNGHKCILLEEMMNQSVQRIDEYSKLLESSYNDSSNQIEQLGKSLKHIQVQFNGFLEHLQSKLTENLEKLNNYKIQFLQLQELISSLSSDGTNINEKINKRNFQLLDKLATQQKDEFLQEVASKQQVVINQSAALISELEKSIQQLFNLDSSKISLQNTVIESYSKRIKELQTKINEGVVEKYQQTSAKQVYNTLGFDNLDNNIKSQQDVGIEGDQIVNLAKFVGFFEKYFWKTPYPGQGVKYTLNLSSAYDGISNSYESLVDEKLNDSGAATDADEFSYVMATFSEPTYVSYVVIGYLAEWGIYYTNGLSLQHSQDGVNWQTLCETKEFISQSDQYKVYDAFLQAKYFRVSRQDQNYISLGTFIFVQCGDKESLVKNIPLDNFQQKSQEDVLAQILSQNYQGNMLESLGEGLSYTIQDSLGLRDNSVIFNSFLRKNQFCDINVSLQAITVEVISEKPIDYIVIYGINLNQAVLQYSEDKFQWNQLMSFAGQQNMYIIFANSKKMKFFRLFKGQEPQIGLSKLIFLSCPNFNLSLEKYIYLVNRKYASSKTHPYPGKGLKYQLIMSSQYAGLKNNFEALTDDQFVNTGAATNSGFGQCIIAKFEAPIFLKCVIISHYEAEWGASYTNGCWIQYSSDGQNWINHTKISGLQSYNANSYNIYPINLSVQYVRIYREGNGYVALGTMIFL